MNESKQQTVNNKLFDNKSSNPIRKRIASNPIVKEAVDIVAYINKFSAQKNPTKSYTGYAPMFGKTVDYNELIQSFNSKLAGKTSVFDLYSAMHEIFTEVLNSNFTAFGTYQENSKCLNLKLYTPKGSTYISKIFLSDKKNPVVECFESGMPVVKDNNKFLNMPYAANSAALILPLNTTNKRRGVLIIGKDNLDMGMMAFMANYCAMFIENIELLEQTSKYENTDNLTGLSNHRGFQEILTAELKRAKENETKLSIVMLDINNLSKINRELGHAKGDEVIKLVSEKIKQNIKNTDSAGRYGGDEIAIILPETDTV
ncbi:MAG: GGDEF domain-containing protein, partial [Heliobacteriaceae bacterium]|nr:GGDEF domain-containing protein [Heliobacteriaceae bacterium]